MISVIVFTILLQKLQNHDNIFLSIKINFFLIILIVENYFDRKYDDKYFLMIFLCKK